MALTSQEWLTSSLPSAITSSTVSLPQEPPASWSPMVPVSLSASPRVPLSKTVWTSPMSASALVRWSLRSSMPSSEPHHSLTSSIRLKQEWLWFALYLSNLTVKVSERRPSWASLRELWWNGSDNHQPLCIEHAYLYTHLLSQIPRWYFLSNNLSSLTN